MTKSNSRSGKKIKDLPLSTRPREKLSLLGVENLATHELMAILLGTGTAKLNAISLSQKILKLFPEKKLPELTLKELMKIGGVGLSKATRIMAALELGNRVFGVRSLGKFTVTSTKDVLDQVWEFVEKNQEHIIVLYLNARHELVQKEVIAVGKLNSALIEPKEVLAPALLSPAASFILVHNHPSGDPQPSKEDISFTLQLQKAAQILGVEMLDHVIVSRSGYFSFREVE